MPSPMAAATKLTPLVLQPASFSVKVDAASVTVSRSIVSSPREPMRPVAAIRRESGWGRRYAH